MNILVESYRAGLFQRKNWLPNIIAGIIVGVVCLPIAMAFAIASGAEPEQGLYTAIVAGVIVSMMGGSRVQIAGPTGAFIVILSGITAKYGISGLQVATMMAGVMLVLFGVTRLGGVIKFIPTPVIVGFTSGIAVVIWVGQWQYFFGLPSPGAGHFHEKFWHLLQSFSLLSPNCTALGLLSLFIVIFCPKMPGMKKIPGPMVALVVVTFLQYHFQFSGVETIGTVFGGIPTGLPKFSIPDLSFNRIVELIGPAFTVALLGAIESLLSAVVADGMADTHHHSNRELIGQGVANIIAPLFGGFAATGAVARTATSIRNGGNSPIAGVVHSITLIFILLYLAPLAVNIPLPVLSAILFMIAWNMSEAKHFVKLFRVAPRADIVTLLVTFFLTIFVDLVVAVNVGVIIAVLHFLRSMASSIEVQQMTETQMEEDAQQNIVPELPQGVMLYTIQGPFFFGAVETFQKALANTGEDLSLLILHLRWVPFVDITALHALEHVIVALQRQGVKVILCGANETVETKLNKAGVIAMIGQEYYFKDVKNALAFCRNDDFYPATTVPLDEPLVLSHQGISVH